MPLGREFLRAPDVVDVIGIAAVNEDVARLQHGQQIGDRLIHHGGRDHQPDRARLRELLRQLGQRTGAGGAVFDQLLHRSR